MLLAEQHVALAKLMRDNGARLPGPEQEKWIRKSNSFVVCARLAAEERGGISLKSFAWKTLTPDWSFIDYQISRLTLPLIPSPSLAPHG
ncbi:MAG: hypothetical protein Q8M31_06715 [Beijerinckiaceae bacterium]|nr:hypothetical protein [Beijerinckiaceae bacterium]